MNRSTAGAQAVSWPEWLQRLGRSRWLACVRSWLYPYRPRFRDRRFWAVQGLVVLIAGAHTGMETLVKGMGYNLVIGSPPVSLLSFVPVSLFFIPVVYAALNFGLKGAVATAVWCTFLTVPNVVMHEGMERVREVFQVGLVDAIAVFVGQRVDREMAARERAEAAGTALRASEARYRGLFESSPVAVLVLGPTGVVLDANPAAGLLFTKAASGLPGMVVADLVGPAGAEALLSRDAVPEGAYLHIQRRNGPEVYLEPEHTQAVDSRGEPVIQVVLRDVTEERHRRAGLRAFAARILRAQEEERTRIAQELHDETVQELIVVCRKLDAVEGVGGPLPDPVVEDLRETRRSVESIVEGLRGFARALRPPTLDDLGLVPALRRVLTDLMERSPLEGQFKVAGRERRLPPDAELCLFRIAQEALRNVERHAQAKHVALTLAFTEGDVRLEVVDDGVGFVLPARAGDFAASGQLGLLGMQERAELLGGRLEIQSTPGKSTRVMVSLLAGDGVTGLRDDGHGFE